MSGKGVNSFGSSTVDLVTVIDHGSGNFFSIARAVEKCGGSVHISKTPEEIARADRIILPGVGAFGDGIAALRASGMDQAVVQKIKSGTPTLAICLGMQLLFENSDEFGLHEGLGILPGKVVSLKKISTENPCRIPQVGWNSLHKAGGSDWQGTLLGELFEGDEVYFNHSYCALAFDEKHVKAVTYIGQDQVTSVVAHDNVTGCQFHPEKSGPVGLRMIQSFLTI